MPSIVPFRVSRKANRKNHPFFETSKNYQTNQSSDALGQNLSSSFVLGILPPKDHDASIAQGIKNAQPLLDSIESASFEEDIELASVGEIEFSDPDLLITNSELLTEGTLLDFQFGYGRNTAFLGRRVQMINMHPNYPQKDIPKIKITGYDGRHYMTIGEHIPIDADIAIGPLRRGKQKAPKSFEKKTHSEAIDMVAKHLGFVVDIDPTKIRKTFHKDEKTSFWKFCSKLAEINNYYTWVDWEDILNYWCLHFRKKEHSFKQGYDFQRGTDGNGLLLSFSPNEDLIAQVTDLEVVSFDKRVNKLSWQALSETTKKEDYKLKTNNSGFPTPYGARAKFRIGGRTISTISSKPFKDKKEAKEFAKRHIVQRQNDYTTARATVIGIENLRPRQIHKFSGIGKYSGYYRLENTKHKIVSNDTYKTELVLHRIQEGADPLQKSLKAIQYIENKNSNLVV